MERLLQFVWENRVGLRGDLRTTDGRSLRVIDPGVPNTDAGPDFFGACVEIGGETWAGNVEIHTRASDWFRHGHQADPAYRSVVLHVVETDDCPVPRAGGGGEAIPQVVVSVPKGAAERIEMLSANAAASLPCRAVVASLPGVYATDWLTSLAMERLYAKSDRVLSLVREQQGDWLRAAYVTLARGLGFGLNSEPLEALARSVPLQFLMKHRDNLLTVEALLMGQAGMIPAPTTGEEAYIGMLRQEYAFMVRKFSLRQPVLQWKMARTRPQNFPYRRVACLAEIIHQGFRLFDDLVEADTAEKLRELFRVDLEGFWATHLTPQGAGARSARGLGQQQAEVLAINVAVPLKHARAAWRDDSEEMGRAAELWEQLAPEDNRHTRVFTQNGLTCADAFTSQAMVQLRREYCEKRKCMYCRFGQKMFCAELQHKG